MGSLVGWYRPLRPFNAMDVNNELLRAPKCDIEELPSLHEANKDEERKEAKASEKLGSSVESKEKTTPTKKFKEVGSTDMQTIAKAVATETAGLSGKTTRTSP